MAIKFNNKAQTTAQTAQTEPEVGSPEWYAKMNNIYATDSDCQTMPEKTAEFNAELSNDDIVNRNNYSTLTANRAKMIARRNGQA